MLGYLATPLSDDGPPLTAVSKVAAGCSANAPPGGGSHPVSEAHSA
jgi:hypothetical protein